MITTTRDLESHRFLINYWAHIFNHDKPFSNTFQYTPKIWNIVSAICKMLICIWSYELKTTCYLNNTEARFKFNINKGINTNSCKIQACKVLQHQQYSFNIACTRLSTYKTVRHWEKIEAIFWNNQYSINKKFANVKPYEADSTLIIFFWIFNNLKKNHGALQRRICFGKMCGYTKTLCLNDWL